MLNVLVLDDDAEFRAALGEALTDTARVADVGTPVEALSALERQPVDILICDLHLALGTSGAEGSRPCVSDGRRSVASR